ncbi:MAG: hypothetical protein ACTINL_08710 [Serratia proteamaculans]
MEAKEIRDAFIALYSEAENAGTYEHLDSVVKDATGGIFSKKYSQCGSHVGNIHYFVETEIPEGSEIGEFKNLFVFLPKGIEGLTTKAIPQKKYTEAYDECARLIRYQLDVAIDAQRARQAWEELLPTINLDVLAHVLSEQLNGVGRDALKYSK